MTETTEIQQEVVRAQPLCANCDTPMLGEFCHACGQPRKGMIRHLSGLMADFFDSVFNLDSRTLRTLWPLFARPGFLSNEYFAGRRTRYVTPLRLYVFLSVIAFFAVATVSEVGDDQRLVRFDGGDAPVRALADIDADERAALAELEPRRGSMPDAAFAALGEGVRAGFEEERERSELWLERGLKVGERPPSEVTAAQPNPRGIRIGGDSPWHPLDNPVRIGWASDAMNAWLNRKIGALIANGLEAEKHPAKFVATIFGVAPQALLLILPLFALLLKLFYLFKRRLFMEHLIVALHSHSFLCLAILLQVLLSLLAGWSAALPLLPRLFGVLGVLLWIWIPLYLLVAQKRIYGQGWPMTLWKYFLLGNCYMFLLTFGVVLNLFLALATL